jgi:prevent-host-death family protein
MDINEIKKLIDEDGGKIILVENGEPILVVTSYADYKKNKVKSVKAEPQTVNQIPPELTAEELKIEDLPF